MFNLPGNQITSDAQHKRASLPQACTATHVCVCSCNCVRKGAGRSGLHVPCPNVSGKTGVFARERWQQSQRALLFFHATILFDTSAITRAKVALGMCIAFPSMERHWSGPTCKIGEPHASASS
eukprot:13332514-Alexandrium_andersonii.AAC.1